MHSSTIHCLVRPPKPRHPLPVATPLGHHLHLFFLAMPPLKLQGLPPPTSGRCSPRSQCLQPSQQISWYTTLYHNFNIGLDRGLKSSCVEGSQQALNLFKKWANVRVNSCPGETYPYGFSFVRCLVLVGGRQSIERLTTFCIDLVCFGSSHTYKHIRHTRKHTNTFLHTKCRHTPTFIYVRHARTYIHTYYTHVHIYKFIHI